MVRFHLDEHVDSAVAHGLRSRGIDVTTSADAGLLGNDDDDHLQFALSEQRVVVTHDADFPRLAASGAPHAGIAYCAPGSRSVGELIAILCLMNDVFEAADISGRVEYL